MYTKDRSIEIIEASFVVADGFEKAFAEEISGYSQEQADELLCNLKDMQAPGLRSELLKAIQEGDAASFDVLQSTAIYVAHVRVMRDQAKLISKQHQKQGTMK